MSILVTGSGKSGSWAIRGLQLGGAIGATVLPHAIDIGPFDLAVVVKRPGADLVQRIHRAGVPLVWDVVDAWPQPGGNDWPKADCLAWLRQQVSAIRPAGIVAATEAMARDCQEFGLPVLALPHHARPGQRRRLVRPVARVVGYEGGPQYVQRWGRVLARECERRGMRWEAQPKNMEEVDVLVALRDQTGYAPMHWKSNVKLANAQGSGTPIICARESGYTETAAGGVLWADTPEELAAALDGLAPQATRECYSRWLLASTITLDATAQRYLAWLQALRS